jgi:glycosyltransferase involved in cell wall biosynthesis
MNWITLGLTLASLEAFRAEGKLLKTLVSTPTDRVTGPLVSVIIPAFNEERYLPAVLQALDHQSYMDIETIVVDNDSTDSTVQIAKDWGAKILVNQVPANINMSRNMGARAARGDYFVFLDADTIPTTKAIENSVIALQNDYDLVYPSKCSTDDHLMSMIRVIGCWLEPGTGFTAGGAYIATRRDVLEAVDGWDESLDPLTGKGGEDGHSFTGIVSSYGYSIGQLKTTYVGTSDRRHKVEGALNPTPWKSRAVRGYESVKQLWP